MASNEPRMSKGSTATNTRTVGGKLSTTAGPQAHGAAWRPKHRRRTRPERCRPKERNGPVPARAMSLQVRARPKCAQWALPLSMLFAASSATSCRAARYSSARRGASAHRRRARAHKPALMPLRSAARRHRTASRSSSIFRPTDNRNLRVAIEPESCPSRNHPALADGSLRSTLDQQASPPPTAAP